MATVDIDLEKYQLGWHDSENDYVFKPRKGLNEEIIREMSEMKSEPEWMLAFRLKAYQRYLRKPVPTWGGGGLLQDIDFDDIYYYIKPTEGQANDWDMVPDSIKETYEKLGIPEAERKYLAGVTAQYESEVVYHRNREDLEEMGVLFCDMDTAVRDYSEIVMEYFGTVIPPNDNKFAALNSAVWSGGSFIYVPPGVHVDQPLQAYFRINAENMGQFERTLIIVDDGAFVHYVEGCSAPTYTSDSLHSAVVEIVVKEGGRCRYTTIQNWSNNVYNLVTKRAAAYRNATMEWVDGNLGCLAEGSRVTTLSGMKPIERVLPGEDVLSFDEEAGELCWRPVVAKLFAGNQRVHEIRVGNRRLRVTDNHPFYSYRYDPVQARKLGKHELGYVRADEIERAVIPVTSIDFGAPHKLEVSPSSTTFRGGNQHSAGFVAVRERSVSLDLPEETTDDIMWLFGLYLANGSTEVRHADNEGIRWAKVVFSLPERDRARSRLIAVMGDLMPGEEPTERADGVTVTWNSSDLVGLLFGNGLKGAAIDKTIPEWVLQLPETQRLSFVAGFVDGGGSGPSGCCGISVNSANPSLLEGLAELLMTLGVTARIYPEFSEERIVEIRGYEATDRGSHRLEFAADPRLLRRVSSDFRDAVGRQSDPMLRDFRRVRCSSIELPATVEIRKVERKSESEIVGTWDIEVAGEGNFVSEGFIVHNSKLTMKYPAVWLMEDGAHGEVLSIAFAGDGQHLDAGAKIVHAAPNTTSLITSKSISMDGGRAGYRGLIRVENGAKDARSFVRCDALILDEASRSDTYPYMEIEESNAQIAHEATISKVGDDQLFYLMSRGLSEEEATAMIVAGFIEPIVKELPMEYAVELNRLIELQMEGSVG